MTAALVIAVISFSSCSDVRPKEVTLNSLNDSINYTLGLWQGDVFKQQFFAEDEDGKMLKAFIAALDEAYKSNEAPNEMYELGLNVGNYFKNYTENGFFGDESLKGDQKLILKGMINAIKDYQEVMTSTQADSIVQAIQMRTNPGQVEVPEN